MKTTKKIMLLTAGLFLGLIVRAQDTKSQFNPIRSVSVVRVLH